MTRKLSHPANHLMRLTLIISAALIAIAQGAILGMGVSMGSSLAWMSGLGGAGLIESSRRIPWILDNDGGSTDKGDLQDIGAAIYMHQQGWIDLKAVIVTAGDEYTAPASRAILDYYGLTDVPVGAYQKSDIHIGGQEGTPARRIRDAFLPDNTRADYPDAVAIYESVLTQADHASVVVSVSGFINSLSDYLQTPGGADAFNGATQILGLTAGQFPNSSSSASTPGNFNGAGEWNLGGSDGGAKGISEATAAVTVGSRVTAPVFWHGVEICGNTGNDPMLGNFISSTMPVASWPDDNPIKVGWVSGSRTSWDVMGPICYFLTAWYGAQANPYWTENRILPPTISVSNGTEGQNSSLYGLSNHAYMTPKLGARTLAQWRSLMVSVCETYVPSEPS